MDDKAVILAAEFVAKYEAGPNGGFAKVPYRCPSGKQTIGWGHVIRPNERIQTPITEKEANVLLAGDLNRAYQAVIDLVRVKLTEAMLIALISFTFNLGVESLKSSKLLGLINRQLYLDAADQFLIWNKTRDTATKRLHVLAGLTRRRKEERELFLSQGMPE